MKIIGFIILLIIALLAGQRIYFRFLAPFANHANKSYLWHSGRMKALSKFKHQVNYVYSLKNLALRQLEEKDKNHLLLICTDLASDLRMGCTNQNQEQADEVFWKIKDIYDGKSDFIS